MTAWLLDFMVHSTFWLGLAWAGARLGPGMHPRTRETVWYTAVLAGLITSSVHAVDPERFTSLWSLTLPGMLSASTAASPGALKVSSSTSYLDLDILLLAAWISVSGLLLLRRALQLVLLRHRLGRTDAVETSREARVLEDISTRAGLARPPRLSVSDHLGSPIVMGLGARAEICLPSRAAHELDSDQFRAMLAHEVAHHRRRDPARLSVVALVQSVFFFQPLLRVAGREMHWAAEEQCDAWAADYVQDRLAMASCLTEVAAWILPGDRALPVPGLVRRRSQLARRVNRLIDERRSPVAGRRFWRVLVSMAVLAFAPWLTPGLATEVALAPSAARLSSPARETTLASQPRVEGDADHSSEGEEHGHELQSEVLERSGEHADEDEGTRAAEIAGEHQEEHGQEPGHSI